MNSGQPAVLDNRHLNHRKDTHTDKLERALSASGLSARAKRFLTKALHPASDVSSPGIPDQNEVDLYRTELRATLTISKPDGLVSGNWDCLIWCPPGDNTVFLGAVGVAGTDFRTATLSSASPPPPGTVHVTRFTFTDNVPGGLFAGSLSNWTAAKINATDWVSPPLKRFFATTYGKLMPKRWRTTASSVTMNLIANATQNQGTVYAWEGGRGFNDGVAIEQRSIGAVVSSAPYQPQTACWESTGALADIEYRGVSGGSSVPQFTNQDIFEAVQAMTTSVPFDESDMFIQTPHLYATNAYNGAYIVHRFCGPDQRLQNTAALPHTVVVPLAGLDSTGGNKWDVDATYDTGRFLAQNGAGTNPYYQYSTPQINVVPMNIVSSDLFLPGGTEWSTGLSAPPWLSAFLPNITNPDTSFDNVTQSVTIWRGLDPDATIQLKRLLSIEAAPLETSPSRPFVTPPIPFEPRALALYYEIAHRMEAVYPADYNDFGSILHKIAEVVKSVAAPIGGVLSMVAPEFAPEIGAVAAGATGIADLVSNMTKKQKAAARTALSAPPPRPRLPRPALRLPTQRRPAPKRQPRRRALVRL